MRSPACVHPHHGVRLRLHRVGVRRVSRPSIVVVGAVLLTVLALAAGAAWR